MKKWIFPFIFLVFEIACIFLYLTPLIYNGLPHWIQQTLSAMDAVLNWFTNWMRLPTIPMGNGQNAILSNLFVLFLLNVIIFVIYFLIVWIRFIQKKRKQAKKENTSLPKNEFDPLLFVKKMPTFRLAFLWVPWNLWILYFIVLNSLDVQEKLQDSMKWLYDFLSNSFTFYQENALPLVEKDITFRIVIFIAGMVIVTFVYWMIFSFFAVLFRKQLASMRARHALKAHEKRVAQCQREEVVVENLEILERAKFRHNRSIVETIADVDHDKSIEKSHRGSDYFEHIAHGIADLGVKKEKELDKPITIRKPIKVIYPTGEEKEVVDKTILEVEEKDLPKIPLVPELDALLIPTEEIKEEKIEETTSEEEIIITPIEPRKGTKPITPKKLRPRAKIKPVTPRIQEELNGGKTNHDV